MNLSSPRGGTKAAYFILESIPVLSILFLRKCPSLRSPFQELIAFLVFQYQCRTHAVDSVFGADETYMTPTRGSGGDSDSFSH